MLAGRTDTGHIPAWPEGPTQIGHLVPKDRTWHNGATTGQLSVTIDDTGTVTWTTATGQTRTVTPYDYRLEPHDPTTANPAPQPADGPGHTTETDVSADPEPPPF